MKKFITVSGFVASILTIIGMVMKVIHMEGASICLVLGMLFLILFFLPSFGYNLLFDFTNKKSKLTGVLGSVLFISIGAGAVFKIQHWNGAGAMYALEYLILCFLLLPALMIVKIKSSSSGKEKGVQFLWYLSLIVISLGSIFKTMHWAGAGPLLVIGTFFIALGYLPLAFSLYNNDENRSKLYSRFAIIVAGLIYVLLVEAGSVSKSILYSFITMDDGLKQTSTYLNMNNESIYSDFQIQYQHHKSQFNYSKAMKVKDLSNDLFNHIEKLKTYLMQNVQRTTSDSISLTQVDAKDNSDVPTHILIQDPENPNKGAWSAIELKSKMAVYKQDILSMFDGKDKEELSKMIGLNTDDIYSVNEGATVSWENYLFYRAPIAAVIPFLTKLQNDVCFAESKSIDCLYKNFSNEENNFKYDCKDTRGDTLLLYKCKR